MGLGLSGLQNSEGAGLEKLGIGTRTEGRL